MIIWVGIENWRRRAPEVRDASLPLRHIATGTGSADEDAMAQAIITLMIA